MVNTRVVTAIFKKEFASYFSSPIAYIFITIFLLVTNWLFFKMFFIFNQAGMREYFSFLPWVFLFLVPAVSMRMWAEEKRVGTIELLLTLPISDFEAILGKFLASFVFLCLTITLSITLPVTIAWLGDPDAGPIIGGYVGAYLMAGAYLAIGLFVSSLTQNQIVAFIVGIAISFALLIVGEPFVLMALPNFLVPLFSFLGLGAHFDSISRGVIDSRDVLYYLSVIVFFLYLNVRSVESRKWK